MALYNSDCDRHGKTRILNIYFCLYMRSEQIYFFLEQEEV